MTLQELTLQTIQQHKLLPPESKLVVGVSGGADSLALLHILHTLHSQLPVDLHVATFDHGLRGQAGADDVQFVIELCEQWGVPVTAGAQQVQSEGGGIESAARNARYGFLANVAHNVGANTVAVAHHADDQAETVLMRLIRGAGLRGLSGMRYRAPLPDHPDVTLIRPLLDAQRRDIEVYCQEHNLTPRQDASNQDTSLLRNRIRLETLPALRQMNPQVDEALIQLARQSALEYAFLRHELDARTSGKIMQQPGRMIIQRATFIDLPSALQRQYIADVVQGLGGRDTGYEHIVAAVDMAITGHTGQLVLMPGGIRLRLDYDAVVIEQADADFTYDGPLLPVGTHLPVIVPGVTPLPDSTWQLETSQTEIPQAHLKWRHDQPITLRTRQPGDRFMPLGLGGHSQTVKKWMIDHKVPHVIRNEIPLLIIDNEIAAFIIGPQWIYHERFKADKGSQMVIYAAFKQKSTT